ncbi:hypothetical protein KIH39_21220 [Telmatocola sphagniphila]|uniref:Hint domain-containing protein n=1 Tax=Telmatocola sphagniphila TaxID=1123043 RepID=A0A8E6EXD5_9BACT|nr:hypothetical protein KIH39_21220 [Telmatocola sphagniphila]
MQSIKAGEYVYSRNDADPNGPIEPKLVEETFSRLAVIFHLQVENQVIRTTGEHPFFAEGKGWVDAQELLIGDRVLGSNGEWLTIRDLLDTGEFETVYNMRIADHHTYFVGDDRWGWEVWSHNKCIGEYADLRKIWAGAGKQIHHLLEQRFAKLLGMDPMKM